MTDTSHSPLLDRYLAEVGWRLRHLSAAQREDILAGILEHIADLETDGVAPEEIVARLGSPESVADAAAGEFPPPPGEPPAPSRFFDGKRWVQLVAVLLAVRVLGGLLLGVGVVASWLAWNNRQGPGEVCTGSAQTMLSCGEQWDPAPFVIAAAVAVVLAVVLEAWTRRRPLWRRAAES